MQPSFVPSYNVGHVWQGSYKLLQHVTACKKLPFYLLFFCFIF